MLVYICTFLIDSICQLFDLSCHINHYLIVLLLMFCHFHFHFHFYFHFHFHFRFHFYFHFPFHFHFLFPFPFHFYFHFNLLITLMFCLFDFSVSSVKIISNKLLNKFNNSFCLGVRFLYLIMPAFFLLFNVFKPFLADISPIVLSLSQYT